MKLIFKLAIAGWIAYLPMSMANASPYFRTVWVNASPKPAIGSLLDVNSLKKTDGALVLPIFTHSHNDGHLLFPGEDWSLLTLGVGGTSGNISLAAGPAANVLPVIQLEALNVLNYLDASGEGYKSLRNFLRPNDGGSNQVSISAGPQFVFKPWEGPHGRGHLRIWTGASFQF